MADLTKDSPIHFLGEAKTEKFEVDSLAAQVFYKGVGVIIDQNVDTTHVHTAAAITCVDGDVFIGIAAEGKTVVAGEREKDNTIEVYVTPSIVGFPSAVFTDADIGKTVYMSDTATLSASNGAYPCIGKLFKVEDGYAYVELITPANLDVP